MHITSQNDTELQPDIQQDRTSNHNAGPYPLLNRDRRRARHLRTLFRLAHLDFRLE